jgi:hypothetical protein
MTEPIRLTQQEWYLLRGRTPPEHQEFAPHPSPWIWGIPVLLDPNADRTPLAERIEKIGIRPGGKTVPAGDFVCDRRPLWRKIWDWAHGQER